MSDNDAIIIAGDDRSLDRRRREDDTEDIGTWHGCKSHLKLRREPRINNALYSEVLDVHITFGPHRDITQHNLARSRGAALCWVHAVSCQVRSVSDL